jgi:hypothetical protein
MLEGETEELVQKLGALAGLEFTEPSLERVFHETQGHPEIARKLGSSILEEMRDRGRQPGSVTPDVVTAAIERFLTEQGFTYYFRETYWGMALELQAELGKLILDSLARESCTAEDLSVAIIERWPKSNPQAIRQEVEEALRSLEDVGILSSEQGKWQIVIPLLKTWIRRRERHNDPHDTATR